MKDQTNKKRTWRKKETICKKQKKLCRGNNSSISRKKPEDTTSIKYEKDAMKMNRE